jgi:hypothetical protein
MTIKPKRIKQSQRKPKSPKVLLRIGFVEKPHLLYLKIKENSLKTNRISKVKNQTLK